MSFPTLMIDISRYQKPMDFKKAKEKGIVAVAARATVGNYYTDPCFQEYYEGAKAEGLGFTPYLVVAPADSYNNRISINAHLDLFHKVVGDIVYDLPYVIDCELTRNCTPAQITYTIRGVCEGVIPLDKKGRLPMIYTRKTWWDPNVLRSSLWAKYKLWLAQYNSAIEEPDLIPADWKIWRLWQWSADKNGMGAEYGAGSNDIDLDRYNGTVEQFYEEFNFGSLPPQPPTPPPATDELRFVTLVDLNVRTSPEVKTGNIVTVIPKDTEIKPTDIYSPSTVWVEWLYNGQKVYSAHTYQGSQYMKRKDE